MLHGDQRSLNDKKLFALEREYFRLSQAKNNAPIVPLEHPFQRGWTKKFALRDDIRRRTDSWILQQLLNKFNTTIHSNNEQFIKQGEPIPHELKILPKKAVEKFGWSQQHFKWAMYGHWHDYRSWRGRAVIEGYIFAAPHYFLIDNIQPYFVTHQKVLLPDVEERLQEIENKFTHTQARHRLGKLHGQSQTWRDLKEERKLDELLKVGLDPEQW